MLEPDRHSRGAGAPVARAAPGAAPALPWRGVLRRELAWILLLKLAALTLLWALFFRGGHHQLDAAALSQRLGLPAATQPAAAPRGAPRG